MDEHEHQLTADEFEQAVAAHQEAAEEFEVVDVAEAGIDATVPEGPQSLWKPNRSMVRGAIREQTKKRGAGFTRPMRKGREGAPE